jgi:hypothetical protein
MNVCDGKDRIAAISPMEIECSGVLAGLTSIILNIYSRQETNRHFGRLKTVND